MMTDESSEVSRRTVLKVGGGAAAVGALGLGAAASTGDLGGGSNSLESSPWDAVESPTENTLYDVEYTANGAYTVGGAGQVVHRTADGWTKVVDGGPAGNGNTHYGSDVTDDDARLWFVGASGAIGEYNVETGDLNDYSAPMDVTNNFNDVAVTGDAGEANVFVAGDSGKIYYSFENGQAGTWDSVTPGSGAGIKAIDFHDSRSGHAVDGNQTVFTTSDGTTYEKLGIADSNNNFYAVDSDPSDDVTVSAGGGIVWNWDGAEWISQDTGDAALRDVEADGTPGLTVGGGGVVYRRDSDGWTQEQTPVGDNLKAVLRGTDHGFGVDIAVGAAGTIIENDAQGG
jgi:hypothetical protein